MMPKDDKVRQEKQKRKELSSEDELFHLEFCERVRLRMSGKEY
jgi:hypothetical protein